MLTPMRKSRLGLPSDGSGRPRGYAEAGGSHRFSEGVWKVATKAYFLIRVAREASQDGLADWVQQLEAMPEVRYVAPVTGLYDLVAMVEAPITAVLVAHKMLENGWIKHLHVLRVEETQNHAEPLEHRLARQRQIMRGRLAEVREFVRPR